MSRNDVCNCLLVSHLNVLTPWHPNNSFSSFILCISGEACFRRQASFWNCSKSISAAAELAKSMNSSMSLHVPKPTEGFKSEGNRVSSSSSKLTSVLSSSRQPALRRRSRILTARPLSCRIAVVISGWSPSSANPSRRFWASSYDSWAREVITVFANRLLTTVPSGSNSHKAEKVSRLPSARSEHTSVVSILGSMSMRRSTR
mmetsp:Transcript_18085/g.53975  ORF Transcript_18085/g.53975 Transcript_18085/m.53975 type:complete len:202 (-) Transcript_18085:991-1596(-)